MCHAQGLERGGGIRLAESLTRIHRHRSLSQSALAFFCPFDTSAVSALFPPSNACVLFLHLLSPSFAAFPPSLFPLWDPPRRHLGVLKGCNVDGQGAPEPLPTSSLRGRRGGGAGPFTSAFFLGTRVPNLSGGGAIPEASQEPALQPFCEVTKSHNYR